MTSAQHAAAHTLLTLGLPVFPCRPHGKQPLTPHGLYDATHDPDQIDRWWSRWPHANPALPTGQISGVVVLDIDPRHGGIVTFHRWTDIDDHPLRRVWPIVMETGGGGWHHYYRWPGRRLPNSAGRMHGHPDLPGIDIRGDGGYVLAPGAITTGPYLTMQPPDPTIMDPWPDQLTPPEPLPRPPQPPSWTGFAPRLAVAPAPRPGRLAALVRFVVEAPDGERHNRLHWAARRALDAITDLHTTHGEAWQALSAAAHTVGYPEREAAATLRSVLGNPFQEAPCPTSTARCPSTPAAPTSTPHGG